MLKFFFLTFFLFFIGFWGIFITRKNFIIILLAIEIMLLAVNLNFLFFSSYFDDIVGELFALFSITIAAAESAIGLAILIVYYRLRGFIGIDYISTIKG